jgi:hypothetical protein
VSVVEESGPTWPPLRMAPRAAAEWVELTAAVEGPWTVPCRESDPEQWWATDPETEEAAATVCRRSCPAVGECLAYALAADERYGVWGARTPAERRALRGAL